MPLDLIPIDEEKPKKKLDLKPLDLVPMEEGPDVEFEARLESARKDLPARQEQGITDSERMVIKNLLNDSPAYQREFLENQGYDTRLRNGVVEMSEKGKSEWRVTDPSGFDINDISDNLKDTATVAAGIIGGIWGSAAGFASPIPGGAAIGAAGGGAAGITAVEAGAQKLRSELGLGGMDVGALAKTAQTNLAIPVGIQAGVSGIRAAAPHVARAGREAATRAVRLGKSAVDRAMGVFGNEANLAKVAETAKELGITNMAVGAKGASTKVNAALANTGAKLESSYNTLNEKIPDRVSSAEVYDDLISKVTNTFDDAESEKLLRKELANIMEAKNAPTHYGPLERWKLAGRLEQEAGTYAAKGGSKAESASSELLGAAASKLRDSTTQLAESVGMTEIAKDSAKYHTLKIIQKATSDRLGGRSYKKASTLAWDAVNDIFNKSISGAGTVASKAQSLAEKVPTGTTASTIAPMVAPAPAMEAARSALPGIAGTIANVTAPKKPAVQPPITSIYKRLEMLRGAKK